MTASGERKRVGMSEKVENACSICGRREVWTWDQAIRHREDSEIEVDERERSRDEDRIIFSCQCDILLQIDLESLGGGPLHWGLGSLGKWGRFLQ